MVVVVFVWCPCAWCVCRRRRVVVFSLNNFIFLLQKNVSLSNTDLLPMFLPIKRSMMGYGADALEKAILHIALPIRNVTHCSPKAGQDSSLSL